MWKKNKTILILLFVFTISLLIGCSDGAAEENEGNSESDKSGETEPVHKDFSDEPVTLKVATPWGEEYFMERIGEYVEEIHSHITLEHIDWDGSVTNLEEHYASDIIPDVFLSFSGQAPLEELDSVFPLDEMLEMYSVDLSHIQPLVLDEIRSRDKEQRLVGMPQEVGYRALFYNSEIFDIFGVPYPDPDESMTWDELVELAGKMTGERNGTKYCGLEMDGLMASLQQLSASMTDPETGEVFLTTDPKFTTFMNLMDRIYNIPGIQDEECNFGAKTTAMMVGWHGFLHQWPAGDTEEEAIEYKEVFDLVPLPTWTDLPGVAPSPSGVQPWAINNHSEQKEAALQFLMIATSEEYQLNLARIGTPSVLVSSESMEQYGADNKMYEGKNLSALFKNTPAAPGNKSRWDQYVEFDWEEFAESNVDIQEFLRVTQEESEIKIADVKAQTGE